MCAAVEKNSRDFKWRDKGLVCQLGAKFIITDRSRSCFIHQCATHLMCLKKCKWTFSSGRAVWHVLLISQRFLGYDSTNLCIRYGSLAGSAGFSFTFLVCYTFKREAGTELKNNKKNVKEKKNIVKKGEEEKEESSRVQPETFHINH